VNLTLNIAGQDSDSAEFSTDGDGFVTITVGDEISDDLFFVKIRTDELTKAALIMSQFEGKEEEESFDDELFANEDNDDDEEDE
jgi:hypothetical protein